MAKHLEEMCIAGSGRYDQVSIQRDQLTIKSGAGA